MQVGQFVSGMVNGSIKRKQTPNVDKMLLEETLKFLYDIGRNTREVNEPYAVTYIWKQENAITNTTIKPARDKDGRKDLLNSTVIIKFDDILADVLTYTNILEYVEANRWAVEP